MICLCSRRSGETCSVCTPPPELIRLRRALRLATEALTRRVTIPEIDYSLGMLDLIQDEARQALAAIKKEVPDA